MKVLNLTVDTDATSYKIRDGGQGRGRADAGSRRGGKGMSIPALDAGG